MNKLIGAFPRAAFFAFLLAFSLLPLRAQQAQYPDLPSETPAELKPATETWNYTRREVMIPMRDGVKLPTVILVPKGTKNAPILLTRTPYNASGLTTNTNSS